ncbi:unnamed protein product [Ranitomeya imitator]|uniref:Uncharacterized protein n=1 Tax=Ranitomeya imitator TaxID=111125 RepID=A0ABN9KZ30_9NEOB|nr:unnamed protein product [Ranitomeya imitator]
MHLPNLENCTIFRVTSPRHFSSTVSPIAIFHQTLR